MPTHWTHRTIERSDPTNLLDNNKTSNIISTTQQTCHKKQICNAMNNIWNLFSKKNDIVRRTVPTLTSSWRRSWSLSSLIQEQQQQQVFRRNNSTSSSSSPPPLQHLSNIWPHLTKIQPVRGEGIYLWDKDDNKYMDFTSGIGVTNLGHTHPNIVKAIQEQATRLHFGQMNVVILPQFIELSKKLNDITPSTIDTFFFTNSGAEATEAAVKLVRHATNKRNIIVFQGSFHGRTHQCMAMTTSKYIYRQNYQPLPSGVFVTPYPYCYQYRSWNDEEGTVEFCLQELQRLVASQTSPGETAAIFIEPVLGEGGYVPAPQSFLIALREFCTPITYC